MSVLMKDITKIDLSKSKWISKAEVNMEFKRCGDYLLFLWMENILTDSEYYRACDRFNKKFAEKYVVKERFSQGSQLLVKDLVKKYAANPSTDFDLDKGKADERTG